MIPLAPNKKPSDEQIGYLLEGHKVIGRCCQSLWAPMGATPVYRSNIGHYRQTCCSCGTVLVAPASPAWPELFRGRCFSEGRPPARKSGGS
jgi:hypothetical protein